MGNSVPQRHWARQLLAGLVMATMIAGVLVFIAPAPKAEADCGAPANICSSAPVATTTPGSSPGPGGGGSCGSAYEDRPWVTCGYAPISRNASGTFTGVTGLPAPVIGGIADMDGMGNLIGTTFASGYAGQCQLDTKYYTDPISGASVAYRPKGIFWVDTVTWDWVERTIMSKNVLVPATTKTVKKERFWSFFGVKMSFIPKQYTTKIVVVPAHYINGPVAKSFRNTTARNVTYGCSWPATPSTTSKTCPTSITGVMTGPYDNAKTDPRFPGLLSPTGVDPKQQVKTWTIPRNSSIGSAYAKYGPTLSPGPAKAMSLVLNCPRMDYAVNVSGAACVDTAGKKLTAAACAFTPGNYYKAATGTETTCRYATYPDGRGNVFINCGGNAGNLAANYDGRANWRCDDAAGRNGWDNTYNFANCGGTVPPPTCKWDNTTGAPAITDPYNRKVKSGAQVPADGKQWKVTWPKISGECANADNKWQQFVTVTGSQPFREGQKASGDTQQVFGAHSKAETKSSILADRGSSTGVVGWNKQDLYLRFNQAAPASGKAFTFGSGEVSNPAKKAVKGAVVPYGVYAVYRYTVKKTVKTGPGGSVVINVPFTMTSPMFYVYPTMGRVIG